MNCLDCLEHDQLAAPAVAGCTTCGAGVCRSHLVLTERRLVRTAAMGRQEAVDPPARTARCRTCQAATDGTTQTAAEPLRLPWTRRPSRPGGGQ